MTYRLAHSPGTSIRTTSDAGRIVVGHPCSSVTTSPANRRSAINRTASKASESAVTTGNSSAICPARTKEQYGVGEPLRGGRVACAGTTIEDTRHAGLPRFV